MSDEQDDEALAAEWAAALGEQEDGESGGDMGDMSAEDFMAEAQKAELEPLVDTGSRLNDEDSPNLDVILDIPVTISMEVGSTDLSIRNLLQLNQGSVVELDRLAGEALDVKVNGTLIAHGEVVVVNEKFGIRLTDIISPSERIRKLG
ncbi:MAG: flagellar motor switch protein FliN [Pseudomonadota bacterium]|nr:flagellar motor switch protein FliN [Gammaproteobacteria bacterium]MEC8012223.1 flagellar motor switch protein FliN [Pseudomonadota bacterium]HBF07474.1 flagellar motor switch protein FliN [Gammaproteobacteria bacterium]|tara:strand:+ start:391 stop:834 length:444 start_codon:yes stop_codon:yes gene_type:complete